jgi:hypothetical protein
MAYTYSLSDALWYPGYYHVFKGPWDNKAIVHLWCLEHFGDRSMIGKTWRRREKESQGRWGFIDQHGGTTFVFRDDDDAFEFRIRWS